MMLWWHLRNLKAPNPEKQLRAARRLGRSRDVRAVEALAAAVRDSNASVRAASAEALSAIGTPAIEHIIARVRDSKDPNVRAESAEAFKAIGTPAVDHLVAMFETTWKNDQSDERRKLEIVLSDLRLDVEVLRTLLRRPGFGWSAATALAKHGESGVNPLLDALKEDALKKGGAYGVVEALGEIGDQKAIEPIFAWVNCLEDEGNSLYYALKALEQLATKSESARLTEILRELRERKDIGSQLFALGSDDPSKYGYSRKDILKKLLTYGCKAVVPTIKFLKHQLEYEVKHGQEEAADLLGRLRDERAVEVLCEIIFNKNGAARGEAQMMAVVALRDIASTRAVPYLKEALGHGVGGYGLGGNPEYALKLPEAVGELLLMLEPAAAGIVEAQRFVFPQIAAMVKKEKGAKVAAFVNKQKKIKRVIAFKSGARPQNENSYLYEVLEALGLSITDVEAGGLEIRYVEASNLNRHYASGFLLESGHDLNKCTMTPFSDRDGGSGVAVKVFA